MQEARPEACPGYKAKAALLPIHNAGYQTRGQAPPCPTMRVTQELRRIGNAPRSSQRLYRGASSSAGRCAPVPRPAGRPCRCRLTGGWAGRSASHAAGRLPLMPICGTIQAGVDRKSAHKQMKTDTMWHIQAMQKSDPGAWVELHRHRCAGTSRGSVLTGCLPG